MMPRTDSEAEIGVIRVMPEVLANKIAAGEVVQRPASAAKELMENAIDAGASRVEVHVRDAGRTLIQVVDDGCGLAAIDAVRCFERHATSKIRSIEDLERIVTLGFRGEALASIAAVSRVELRSRRREDDHATLVRIEGGVIEETAPCALAGGTSIAVRHLFYNVPARRSFLKSDATELRHVLDAVQQSALAQPGVAFLLRSDDATVLDLPAEQGPGALERRAAAMFAWDASKDLVPVGEETSYLRVHGVVGRPAIRKKSRGDQYLFVNRRPVRSPYLDHAVFSAFRGLLPDGTYPFFALFLDIDPRHVDVNVHPAKSEVKFDDERGVYAMLKAVVQRSLSLAEGLPRFDGDPPNLLAGSPDARRSGDGSGGTDLSRPVRPSFGPPRAERTAEAPGDLSALLYSGEVKDSGSRPAELLASDATGARGAGRPEIGGDGRLWQLADTYVIAPLRTGLMIVDQHAAHERILFERSLESLDEGFGLSQQLLFPRTVEFSVADFALLQELLTDLRSIGFDVEPLSGRTALIRGVPAGIRTGDEEMILEDVIAQYREFERSERLRGRTNLARSLARRSAIRAGSRLDPQEMRALIDQLFECSQPYAAPDGSPTLVRIGADELDRRFGRHR